ncbi:MAG: porphobilinogen synthase, partial [Gallicola sp.]|nr:porphobilinogen synthase [Gallicola sp.]
AAADSAPACGNRKSYQMDFHNRKEAIKEILQDISEGADIIMVKPALSYLDIIREAANEIHVPLAAYSVSGEYAMIKGASGTGYIDEDRIVAETTISIFRAGADILLTYYAEKIIDLIHKGWI